MRPEEKVRQALVGYMQGDLGFPKEILALELAIKTLPHMKGVEVPDRRLDVVAFGRNIHHEHALYPLLIIECKKDKIDQKAIDQLIGYNHHVKAYFIGLASRQDLILGWKSSGKEEYHFQKGLIPYEELICLCNTLIC